eukprot:s2437_g13.t2
MRPGRVERQFRCHCKLQITKAASMAAVSCSSGHRHRAWAAAEPALIAAQWRNETPEVERPPPPSLVLEEPKLLAGMSIV